MKVAAVIPARFGSTRFPGKPLAPISGQPMISWVIQAVAKSHLVSEVIVATDDSRIFDIAEREGAGACMTPSDLPSGTDRVWAAVREKDVDIVLNVQGDEPLIRKEHIDAVLSPFLKDSSISMATLSHPFATEQDWESLNSVKVIVDKEGNAIYFSRFPIPHSRVMPQQKGAFSPLAQRHIGLYAFRKSFLQEFCEAGVTSVETSESLEQLRALYLGAKIRVVSVESGLHGVDTPDDLLKIESILRESHG